jgi:GrpB-like predicted nucleotidyltransferase (UPF0157 family)
MFFVKGMPPYGTGRTHHVHVHVRDHLVAHPDEARRYEESKRRLAAEFPTDRDAYTNAKTAFVRETVRMAR